MNRFSKILGVFAMTALISGCHPSKNADLIVYNAKIYTVDSQFSIAEAFAITDGKFVAVGKNEDVLKDYHSDNKQDMGGKTIFPGLIDAHCHFYGYAMNLLRCDLQGSKSMQEIQQKLKAFSEANPSGWLVGRGWDQNLFAGKEYPDNRELDKLFPNRPVFLIRIDGHAALVNSCALQLAGINEKSEIAGGIIEKKNGKLTGILTDNAVDQLKEKIPAHGENVIKQALQKAQDKCFAVGLTTVSDAGLDKKIVLIIDTLQKSGELKMRVYAMLNPTRENEDYFVKKGMYVTDYLNVRSIKLYADGALGSRGACLLKPYADADNRGMMVTTADSFDYYCALANKYGYQVCTHAIGDSACRFVLKHYATYLKGKNDLRWRVEHAQVVDPSDFQLFGQYSIIPSVQPTHATSDMYWAEDRLGPLRVKNAYAYKQLMEQNGWLAAGSDFPVEFINPIFGFYAAVARKDQKGFPTGGFQTENALSREQALKAMTIWAARSNFEEKVKGSIEVGKFADFVVLWGDLMNIQQDDIFKINVLQTYVGGTKVYQE